MDISQCSKQVPNCGPNTSPIAGECVSYTSKKNNDGFFTVFDKLIHDVKHNNTIDVQKEPAVLDCINTCNKTTGCSGVRYNSTTGKCELFKNTIDTTPYAQKTPQDCTYVFVKETVVPQFPKGGFTIKSPEDIYTSFDQRNTTKAATIARIQGDYTGVECRKQVANNMYDPSTYSDVLNGMGDFCRKNENKEICKQFCSNPNYANFCPVTTSTVEMIVFIALVFVFLLVLIIFITKKIRWGILGSGIALAVFVGLAVWKIVVYVRSKGGGYNGDQADYPDSANNQVGGCIKMTYACTNTTQPKGDRCTEIKDDQDGYGSKDQCEQQCCSPEYENIDGKCYQRLTPDPKHPSYCPSGYNVADSAECCTATDKVKAGLGDYMCVYTGPHTCWSECTDPKGCSPSTLPANELMWRVCEDPSSNHNICSYGQKPEKCP